MVPEEEFDNSLRVWLLHVLFRMKKLLNENKKNVKRS